MRKQQMHCVIILGIENSKKAFLLNVLPYFPLLSALSNLQESYASFCLLVLDFALATVALFILQFIQYV